MAITNLLGRVGKTITSRPNISRRSMLLGGAAVLAMGQGGSSGFSSRSGDISSTFYETMTGDPNIDEYIFGTDVGLRELMLPTPDLPNPLAAPIPDKVRDLWKNRRYINPTLVGRSASAQRSGYFDNTRNPSGFFHNQAPIINGSIVFGQRNGRSG